MSSLWTADLTARNWKKRKTYLLEAFLKNEKWNQSDGFCPISIFFPPTHADPRRLRVGQNIDFFGSIFHFANHLQAEKITNGPRPIEQESQSETRCQCKLELGTS